MNKNDPFRTDLGRNVFRNKYAQGPEDTWSNLAIRLVDDVCGTQGGKLHPILSKDERDELTRYITNMAFIPGGRYLYYAGRPLHAWNNCFLLKAEEDTREEWSNILHRASSCLMLGGGIGVDYSVLRPRGRALSRTGGISSGPIPLMQMINEVGRHVMQGGSRRSAIYASLHHSHADIEEFLTIKNWENYPVIDGTNLAQVKHTNFNFPAPLDMTNISVNYDDDLLIHRSGTGSILEFDSSNEIFLKNCEQAMRTGEPGFSFNFGSKRNETLRNAPLGPDTYVMTVDGYQQIKNIVGEQVEVWTGKQWSPTVFKKTGDMVPVVKITMSGGRTIIADPTHEFFLEDGTKVPANALEEGQSLLVSLDTECDSFLTKDYYTLGYIYGDGSFNRKYPRAEFTMCLDSSKACFENIDKRLLTSYVEKDSRGFLRGYTKNHSLFERRNKGVFPEDLFTVGTAQQCSFLAGLFDADGNYFEEQNRLRVSSVHFEFLEGTRRLLESIGILSGISKAGITSFGKSQCYTLTIYADFINRFKILIPTKRLNIKEHIPYRNSKIRVISVEPAGLNDVFCCDVGVEEHAFMAEGVIVSNCTEVTSEDDSDVCNLGSINLGNIESLDELRCVVQLASKFLVCGTVRADLPYKKVMEVREKNRRLGLGLMGIHEWLLKRGHKYSVVPELKQWLEVYKNESEKAANEHCDRLYLSRPVAYRAIAPTGTIGILAGTTTGIEPLFSVAYKRRYLTEGTKWKYEYVIDHTADTLIKELGINPSNIQTAYSMAGDYERRIKFQADIQDYVDMSISSTINLPAWGTKSNNEDEVLRFSQVLAAYAPRLRGFTCYPDGSRGGQPITEVEYEEAMKHRGVVYEEADVCRNGVCGI